MPSANKKMKKLAVKAETASPEKELTKSPAKMAVVSRQLEKSMENKKKQRMLRNKGKRDRGILYIKNLPHGFFEEQLQKYFAQFGAVTRVRLCRSLRTGRSRGYAFVEFAVPEVAEVAAETMNNYLMFRKIIKAAYIPPDQIKYNYFKTSVRKITNKAGKETYVSAKTREIRKKVKELNNWSDENYEKRLKRTEKKLRALKRKLGDDADFVDSCVVREPVQTKEENDIETTDLPEAKKRKATKKSTSEEQSTGDSSAVEKTPSNTAKKTLSDVVKKPVSSESETTSTCTPAKPTKKKQKGKKQSKPTATSDTEKSSSSTAAKPAKKKKQKASMQTKPTTTSDTSASSSANPAKTKQKAKQMEKAATNGLSKPTKKKEQKTMADTTLGRLLEDTIEDDSSSDEDFHPDDIDSDDIPGDIYEASSDDDNISDGKEEPITTNDTSSSSEAKSANTKQQKAKNGERNLLSKLSKAIKKQEKVIKQTGKATAKTKEITLDCLLDDTIEDDSSSDDDFHPDGSDLDDIPDDKSDLSDDDFPPDTYELTEESDSDSDGPAVTLNKKIQKPVEIMQKGKPKTLQVQNDTIEDDDSSDMELEFENDSSPMSEESSDDEESSPAKPVKYTTKLSKNKHEKIIQKKPLDGGIRKKSKDKKPPKSHALQQKIKEAAKEIAKYNDLMPAKFKAVTKAVTKDKTKDKKVPPQVKAKQVAVQNKPIQLNLKDIKKKGKKRGH